MTCWLGHQGKKGYSYTWLSAQASNICAGRQIEFYINEGKKEHAQVEYLNVH